MRRRALLGTALLGLAAASLARKAARAERFGVIVYCDETLIPVMRIAADRYERAPVSVFTMSPRLMLAQIAHVTQNDILLTLDPVMDEAVRMGLIRAQTRMGGWRNALVFAARAGAEQGTADLPALLAGRTVSVTDPTALASFDGQAVLERLGITAGRVLGAANTNEVRFLIDSGAAQAGLMYRTDLKADARLALLAPVPDSDSFRYAAALTTISNSPHAQGLLDYLRTPDATAALRAAGLDPA